MVKKSQNLDDEFEKAVGRMVELLDVPKEKSLSQIVATSSNSSVTASVVSNLRTMDFTLYSLCYLPEWCGFVDDGRLTHPLKALQDCIKDWESIHAVGHHTTT